MGWRTVAITKRAKLDLQLGHLVVRNQELIKINIDEIAVLLVECTAVSLTAALLAELTRKKVKVIFCDEKRLPSSELVSYYGSHDTSLKYRKQALWKTESKVSVWTEIVKDKIYQQMSLLDERGREETSLLNQYLNEIEPGDVTNREGHAAKVYFNCIFGQTNSRRIESFENACLNYGYAVLLSAFNREVVANGYNMQLGLAHKNEFNQFNLSGDLMEPFRGLVDRFVFASGQELTPDYKHALCDILNQKVRVGQETCTVSAAIGAYCRSVFDVLEGGAQAIKCYEL